MLRLSGNGAEEAREKARLSGRGSLHVPGSGRLRPSRHSGQGEDQAS